MERTCLHCGASYLWKERPGRPPATCSDECRRSRELACSRSRREGHPTYRVRPRKPRPPVVHASCGCQACGSEFVPATRVQVHCKDVQCVLDRRVARDRGITVLELRELRNASRCEMCGEPFAGRRKCIDHDHVTGAVRGVVHDGCNISLGHVERAGDLASAYLARQLDLRDLCIA